MPPKKATVAAAPKAKAAPKTAAASKGKTTKAAATKAKTTKPAATKKADTKPAATTKRAAANAKKAKEAETEPEESDDSGVEEAPAPKIKTKQTATTTKKKAAPKRKSAEATKDEEFESEEEPAPKKSKTAAAAKKATAANKTAATKKTTTAAAAKKTPAAKKATTTKKATVKKTDSDKENQDEDEDAKPKANTKRKRAAEAEETADGEEIRPKKQPRTKKAPPRLIPKRKVLKKINSAPEAVLDVFVFGEGSAGELGLGSMKVDGKKPIDVKRPRLNPNLSSANVVQISCGGMHAIALTKDNKILTWGVNDQGSLGRDTTWDGGLRDVDAEESDSDDDDDDSGLNPKESTPAEVDMSGVEEDTKFVQVVASDSASFALTEEGKVYGWGTFRVSHASRVHLTQHLNCKLTRGPGQRRYPWFHRGHRHSEDTDAAARA
jgi:regulator of chromosome condensation